MVFVALLQLQFPPEAVGVHTYPGLQLQAEVPFDAPVPPLVLGQEKQAPLMSILEAKLQEAEFEQVLELLDQVKEALQAQAVEVEAKPTEFLSAWHETHLPPLVTE